MLKVYSRVRGFYERLDTEDKVVFIRFLIALVYGVVSYIIYRLGPSVLGDYSSIIWLLSVIVYLFSVIVVRRVVEEASFFILFVRGIITYYFSWILVLFILYDIFG